MKKSVPIASSHSAMSGEPVQDQELQFTQDFASALDLLENSSRNIFLTGRAGTGKSTLLGYFRDNTTKNVAVVAPTGVAAINVRGETIHSFFRLPPRPLTSKDIRKVPDSDLYAALDTIVIDEISMVRADLMDAIDLFLRKNGPNHRRPFGGVQMVMIGDLFQLPPVIASDEEKRFVGSVYGSPYFFSAHVFRDTTLDVVELNHVFRQRDSDFLQLLNGIREKTITRHELSLLNRRVNHQFIPPQAEPFITLTTTNRRAAAINAQNLSRLCGRSGEFEGTVTGEFDTRSLPAPARLELKEGAQVMFVRNDPEGRWVNGTIGRVSFLRHNEVSVEISVDGTAQEIEVEPVTWEMMKYTFDDETGKVEAEEVGAFAQYPLILSYAVTIHKSQGKTFDRMILDLGSGAFAHGQTYVALSRCRSLDGVVLRRAVRPADVRVDPLVMRFMSGQLHSLGGTRTLFSSDSGFTSLS